MEKRHAWHRESPSMHHGTGRDRLIGTALQSDMFLKLVTEQFHAALNQHGGPGHQRAIASPLHKSTDLEETIHIFLRPLSLLNLGHERGEIDGPHSTGWALPATLGLEEIGELERQGHHARLIIDHDHTGRPKPRAGFLQRIEIHRQVELIGGDHRKSPSTTEHRRVPTPPRPPPPPLVLDFPDCSTLRHPSTPGPTD